MQSYSEYLNSHGNLEKPTVKVVADKVDLPADRAKKPPKAVGMKDGQQPYVHDGGPQKASNKGFGHTKGAEGVCYDVSKNVKPAKLPTAESNYDLAQAISQAIQQNPQTIEVLVREFRKAGLLGLLLGETLTHRETYSQLADVMANDDHGPRFCYRLMRAVQESIAPPLHAMHHHGQEVDPMPDPDDSDESATDDEDLEVGPEDPMLGASEEMPNLDDEGNPMPEEEAELDDEGNPLPSKEEDEPVLKPKFPPAVEHMIQAINMLLG